MKTNNSYFYTVTDIPGLIGYVGTFYNCLRFCAKQFSRDMDFKFIDRWTPGIIPEVGSNPINSDYRGEHIASVFSDEIVTNERTLSKRDKDKTTLRKYAEKRGMLITER